jgi:hypothetical protein
MDGRIVCNFGNGTRMTGYCVEGKHTVPKDQLTKLKTSKPDIWRPACIACRDRVLDKRAKAKARK